MHLKSVLILLLFFALQNVQAVEYLNPVFDRPWESQILLDPAPIVSMLYTDGDNTNLSLSYLYSLDSETVQLFKDEVNKIEDANNDYVELYEIRTKTIKKITKILGIVGFVTTADLVSMLLNHWEVAFIITTAGGIEITLDGMEVISLAQEYYTTLVDSLEKSGEVYNRVLSKTMLKYEELEYMGINSGIYTGAQANDIAALKAELESINYNSLLNREKSIKSIISSLRPTSTHLYSNLISTSQLQIKSLIGSDTSALSVLFSVYKRAESIKRGMLNENDAARSAIRTQTSIINSQYNDIYSNYYGITDSDVFYFGISSLETIDSPQSHINNARRHMDAATALTNTGDLTRSAAQKGYVVESTLKYYNALAELDSAAFELHEAKRIGDFILAMAENITQKEYALASGEIANFTPNTEVETKLLAAARTKVKEAETYMKKEGTAQNKIENLKLAFTSLQAARTYISTNSVFYANAKDEAGRRLQYLKLIIDRAKVDLVDVSYEEDYYNRKVIELGSGNVHAGELINISTIAKDLVEGIFQRAAAQYAYLYPRYNVLSPTVNYITEIEGKSPTQYTELSKYIAGTQFDPYKSLGHYTEISSLISALELQVKIKSRDIIKQSFVRNVHTSVSYGNGTIFLDKLVTTKVQLSTYCTLDKLNYSGPITITIPFAHDITKLSVSENSHNVKYSYNSGQLTIVIDNYMPNTLYKLEFSGERPLASTIVTKESSKMTSSTRLVHTVEREFASSALPTLGVVPPYNYEYSLYLDGVYIGDFRGDAVINKPITEGRHKLKYVFTVNNPIVTIVTDTNSTNKSTTIELKATNKVNIDIENAPIIFDLPIVSSKSVSVVSSGCGTRDVSVASLPTSTRVSFSIPIFPKNSSCTFTVNAIAIFDKNSLKKEIERLESERSTNSDLNIDSHISAARAYLDSGRYEDVFYEVGKAREVIENKISEQAQSNARKEEIARLNHIVSTAIDDLSSVRNEEVSKTLTKIKSYYDAANMEQSEEKKVSLLSKAAAEVSDLNAIIYSRSFDYTSDLNELKQRWLYLIDKGYASAMPPEISTIESMINNISMAPANSTTFQLLDSVKESLSILKENTSTAEKDEKAWESTLKGRFKSALSTLKTLESQLLKSCSSKCPQELISSSQALLQLSPDTPNQYVEALKAINTTITNIDVYLQTQRNAANTAIGELRSAVTKVANKEEREILTKKLYDVESLYEKGNYEKAKDAAVTLLNAIHSSPKSENDYTLVLIGLAVVLISFLVIKIKDNNGKIQQEIQKQLKRNQ